MLMITGKVSICGNDLKISILKHNNQFNNRDMDLINSMT